MIKSVINKNKGVVLLPWILDDNTEISRDKVFTSFPTNDTDFCEKNLYGFTRFTKPEVFYKMRLHLAYPETARPTDFSLLESNDLNQPPRTHQVQLVQVP